MTDTFTVTFIFKNAVVTTAILGGTTILPRASSILRQELGIDTDQAQEFHIYAHPKEDSNGTNQSPAV